MTWQIYVFLFYLQNFWFFLCKKFIKLSQNNLRRHSYERLTNCFRFTNEAVTAQQALRTAQHLRYHYSTKYGYTQDFFTEKVAHTKTFAVFCVII